MNREDFFRQALEEIRDATIAGKVCPDVAWSPSKGETLFDYCLRVLEYNPAQGELFQPTHTHYKGGLYQKLFDARHTETGEIFTIYRDDHSEIPYARPKAMFDSEAPPSPGAGARPYRLRFTPIPK